MFPLNKRAVSLLVAYVILITIAISLSAMVYAWLRWYVEPGQEIRCDEGTSLVIKHYNYDCISKRLNVTLQNKGRFTVGGFILRTHSREGARIGIYKFGDHSFLEGLKPGEDVNYEYPSDRYPVGSGTVFINGVLTFMEVQPYILKNGNPVYCGEVATQVLSCS